MTLEIRKAKDGKVRPHWYGRYKIDGKRYCVNLGVKLRGKVPDSLKGIGDITFEKSRQEAQWALDKIIEEAKQSRNASELLKRSYEIAVGTRVQEISLKDLAKEWARLPRSKRISARHELESKRKINKFVEFIESNYRGTKYISQVTSPMANHYMRHEQNRGISPKTYNDILKLLRSTFEHLREDGQNPFKKILPQAAETVFKKPFTEQELQQILEVSERHPFIRPIIILGIMTAMRRGDCCLLKWSDIDLETNFIRVKTSKTSTWIEIPIWPLLREELLKAKAVLKEPTGYVYPLQAKMYQENPDGITWRIKKVLNEAGFQTEAEFTRENGLRKASVHGFHAFRVTWVTLALNNGVPLELIQKVTGHKTIEIVLKHYYQPKREDFKNTLQAKMPAILKK